MKHPIECAGCIMLKAQMQKRRDENAQIQALMQQTIDQQGSEVQRYKEIADRMPDTVKFFESVNRKLKNKIRGLERRIKNREREITELQTKNAELLRRGPAVKTAGDAQCSLVHSIENVYL